MATTAEVPTCPSCAKIDVVTVAKHQVGGPATKIPGKGFYVCPLNDVHPNEKFFMMESKFLEIQNYNKKRAAAGLEPAASAAPSALKKANTAAGPAIQAADHGFAAELLTMKQQMCDLLVQQRELLAVEKQLLTLHQELVARANDSTEMATNCAPPGGDADLAAAGVA